MGMFYLDDGIIISQYPYCLQGAINVLIGLFCRVKLRSNVTNSRTMTIQSGDIHTGMSDEAFNRSIIGGGATYWDHLCILIPCPECRVDLKSGSMIAHIRLLHGIELEIYWYCLQVSHMEHLIHVFEVSSPTAIQPCQCPFPFFVV